MSLHLDGIDYTVDQPTDNALNLLNYINAYLLSIGSTVQFIVNAADPIWLIILGMGYMLTTYQRLVYAAGQSFNISSCSDQQLLNLAEIAGTSLLEGSATLITCHITAGAGGACVITKTLAVTLTYEGNPVIFHPVYEVTIPASTSADITLQANVNGPLYIAAGAITAFDTAVPNLSVMSSLNARPGNNMETMIELRRRLQRGANTIAGISACATAIRNLVGVHTANVYFNHSLTVNLVIETMTILPRSCGMFVQGYSDFIADTYFKFMSVPCVGGTQSQDFITQSGQVITITYSLPSQITIYIKVRVRIPPTLIVPEGYEDTIKTLLLPASNSLLIGQDYTQKYLVAFLEAYNVPDIEIIGLSLSTDNITFSDTTDLLLNQIGVITLPNITVEEVI